MANRPLTVLEFTALGIVMKRQPCNAHTVLKEFSASTTGAYRSGAGSVYPLMQRLTDRKLLREAKGSYSITPKGIEAIATWILPPNDPLEVTTNLDTVRSRVYFLQVLSPEDSKAFVSRARQALESILESSKQGLNSYRKSGDPFSEMAQLGVIRETEARLAWLNEVEAMLDAKQKQA